MNEIKCIRRDGIPTLFVQICQSLEKKHFKKNAINRHTLVGDEASVRKRKGIFVIIGPQIYF